MIKTTIAIKNAAKNLRRFEPALRLAGVAATLAVAAAAAQAPLDIRVALIIGNSAYVGAPLINPANDARAMSEILRSLGFQVVELRDGNKAQMAAAISKVRDTLKGKQGVGMLYYAGHGLQLDWHNYMVPVDARLSSAADVPSQTIDLGLVIEAFKGAGNRMNIVVLDACRDNPFASSTSSAKGLAQLDAPPGTFLAYATAPGNVAEDGDEKSGNGLYTQYLLQELKKPTAKIEDVFKRVRLNVRKQSQGRQIPWESTSLEDDFFFNDGVKYTIKPEELERIAAEARMREQQRLAQEAQARERERQLALEVTRERERQQAEARALEQQRIAAEARAKEQERLAADARVREQERLAAEARALEQQKTAAEARAKEQERLAADARVREQERLAAEARALEQQRLAAEARAREAERLGAEARVKEQEKLAAEARVRVQQRMAAEARAKEQERLAAEARALEQERLSAEARKLEQQRLAAEARAREQERLAAEARTREQERLAVEARGLEQQRLALEARARERERALALEQAKERERLVAEAKAREQERVAEVARLKELERLAAGSKAPPPDKKLSKEELQEIAFKEAKATWDRIKTSSNPNDFYAFLERFPSGGELAEMAQYRLDQLAKPKIQAALGKGQDASLGYTGERYKVGDEFQLQTSDILTNVPGPKRTVRVTAVDGDVVQVNGGNTIMTALGATIKNPQGTYDPPFGGAPVEFQVGKTWSGRSTRQGSDGIQELQHHAKIVGRETITVPAGTFQTYAVEIVVYVTGGATVTRKLWLDPRYGYPIKREEMARARNGRIFRSDREELVALKAQRS